MIVKFELEFRWSYFLLYVIRRAGGNILDWGHMVELVVFVFVGCKIQINAWSGEEQIAIYFSVYRISATYKMYNLQIILLFGYTCWCAIMRS